MTHTRVGYRTYFLHTVNVPYTIYFSLAPRGLRVFLPPKKKKIYKEDVNLLCLMINLVTFTTISTKVISKCFNSQPQPP